MTEKETIDELEVAGIETTMTSEKTEDGALVIKCPCEGYLVYSGQGEKRHRPGVWEELIKRQDKREVLGFLKYGKYPEEYANTRIVTYRVITENIEPVEREDD